MTPACAAQSFKLVLAGVICVYGLLCGTTSTQAASFSCTPQSKPDEQAICKDRDLSELDVRLSIANETARSRLGAEAFADLRKAQIEWLGERRKCDRAIDCLKKVYMRRLDDLREFGAGNAVGEDEQQLILKAVGYALACPIKPDVGKPPVDGNGRSEHFIHAWIGTEAVFAVRTRRGCIHSGLRS